MSKQNSQSKGHINEDIGLIEWAINSTATGAGIFDILYCWRVAKYDIIMHLFSNLTIENQDVEETCVAHTCIITIE